MPDEKPNGNTLRYRVEQLEARARSIEQGTKLLADFGQRGNEQIQVHGSQLAQIHEELREVRVAALGAAQATAVLRADVASITDTLRAARNAFFAAAGSMVVVAMGIVYQAAS